MVPWSMLGCVVRIAIALGLLALPLAAAGHESGAAYLRLRAEGGTLVGELELGTAEVLARLGLSPELPEDAAWREIAAGEASLVAWLEDELSVSEGGRRCVVETAPEGAVAPAATPGFVELRFAAHCGEPLEQPRLRFAGLFEPDPTHRAYVALHHAGGVESAVLGATSPSATFDLRPPGAAAQLAAFLRVGADALLRDGDALLLLVALLLPAPFARGGSAPSRHVLREVAAVLAALAVSAACSFALAPLVADRLPPIRALASATALSVMLVALANLRPPGPLGPRRLAVACGLLHGLGFAAQLAHHGVPAHAAAAARLGFGLAILLGWSAVAALALPSLLALRHRPAWRRAAVAAPSLAIAWLAAVWAVERAFGISLLG